MSGQFGIIIFVKSETSEVKSVSIFSLLTFDMTIVNNN